MERAVLECALRANRKGSQAADSVQRPTRRAVGQRGFPAENTLTIREVHRDRDLLSASDWREPNSF